ncbi:MAG: glycosyltransferase [Micavibrio sp.]
MSKVIFVSSADSNYFPLLAELVHSIRRHPESAGMDIGILNAGMNERELDYLRAQGCIVKEAEWPVKFPASKIKGKDYLKSCICRPFLPDYFPGYETICWMDADTWIQRWDVIPQFLGAAQSGKIALTAQADRSSLRPIRVQWLGPFPLKVKGFYMGNARGAFGMGMAKKLMPYSPLLAGMFALRSDAPHWKRWQEILLKALEKGKIFTAEQLSLGIMCYLENYPYDILPGWMHWLCTYPTHWDEQSQMFTEPFTPHEKLGVLHLSGVDKMREDREETMEFQTAVGGVTKKSFRYPYFDGSKIFD